MSLPSRRARLFCASRRADELSPATYPSFDAGVAELANAAGLGPVGLRLLEVRVLPPAWGARQHRSGARVQPEPKPLPRRTTSAWSSRVLALSRPAPGSRRHLRPRGRCFEPVACIWSRCARAPRPCACVCQRDHARIWPPRRLAAIGGDRLPRPLFAGAVRGSAPLDPRRRPPAVESGAVRQLALRRGPRRRSRVVDRSSPRRLEVPRHRSWPRCARTAPGGERNDGVDQNRLSAHLGG